MPPVSQKHSKPCRYAHAPAFLDKTRERVVLDLPKEQLPQLLQFLTQTLSAQKYTQASTCPS